MIEKRKIKVVTAKHQKVREEINMSNKKKGNYKSNTKDKIDLNQAGNNKYRLQFWKEAIDYKKQSVIIYIQKSSMDGIF